MFDEYTIDNLHYNSKGVIQVSSTECFENLTKTLEALETGLSGDFILEQNMLSFFKEEVEPKTAYRDNDVNQGIKGPRRLHAVGKLKKIKEDNGIFVRLGISAPGENPLILALQVFYLLDENHVKYMVGQPIGIEKFPNKWAYEFTDRYQGMVEGVKVRTRLGIRSLSIIPAINEAILNWRNKNFKFLP